MKATFKCSTLSILLNLVVIADMVLKRKLSQTLSVITVQARIFTGLDRNDLIVVILVLILIVILILKRISEIMLSMNAKVLFLVI